MPTYEYACKDCGEHVEVVQSFKDEPLTECPSCGGPLRKVFGSIGIVFKGSGFYRTDSRIPSRSESKGDKAEAKSETKAETNTEAKSDTKSDTKSKSDSTSAKPVAKDKSA